MLGLRADPPELILDPDAGLPVTQLRAYVVDPADASVSVRFALCLDLSGVPSPSLDCPGDAGLDLPDASLNLGDPGILAFAAGLHFDGGSGGIQAALDNGVPLLVGYKATTASESSSGFQTITLRTTAHGPVNQNPVLLDLEIGDGGLIGTGETVRLQPDAGPKDLDSEHYLYSFFTTAGEISSFHSTDTTSTGQSAPTWVDWTSPSNRQDVDFWVVVRDGRGGIHWRHRTLTMK